MHLFGNKIHANNTTAHLCSSFTPLIAKPMTAKHNNLSKYRRQKNPVTLTQHVDIKHTYLFSTDKTYTHVIRIENSHLVHQPLLSIEIILYISKSIAITAERSF